MAVRSVLGTAYGPDHFYYYYINRQKIFDKNNCPGIMGERLIFKVGSSKVAPSSSSRATRLKWICFPMNSRHLGDNGRNSSQSCFASAALSAAFRSSWCPVRFPEICRKTRKSPWSITASGKILRYTNFCLYSFSTVACLGGIQQCFLLFKISDDEDDTHPNIDTPSLFRWRHQARVEKMNQFQSEKTALEQKRSK